MAAPPSGTGMVDKFYFKNSVAKDSKATAMKKAISQKAKDTAEALKETKTGMCAVQGGAPPFRCSPLPPASDADGQGGAAAQESPHSPLARLQVRAGLCPGHRREGARGGLQDRRAVRGLLPAQLPAQLPARAAAAAAAAANRSELGRAQADGLGRGGRRARLLRSGRQSHSLRAPLLAVGSQFAAAVRVAVSCPTPAALPPAVPDTLLSLRSPPVPKMEWAGIWASQYPSNDGKDGRVDLIRVVSSLSRRSSALRRPPVPRCDRAQHHIPTFLGQAPSPQCPPSLPALR